MTITVLTEREQNPLAPGWHDCVFASGIMALAYGGFDKFPLGYTAAEREALERSCSRPPETGATMADLDEAILNRYNLKLRPLGSSNLASELDQQNTGLVLFGFNGNLPADSNWRRWDPAFTGEHAEFIECEVLAAGESRVLDPEAPMGWGGDLVPNSEILTFAKGAGDCRIVTVNEFAPYNVGLAGSKSIFGTLYPDYVHSYADAFTWTLRVLAYRQWATSSGYIPDPTHPVNFADKADPFGTDYPNYVFTYADAISWISRALQAAGKIS